MFFVSELGRILAELLDEAGSSHQSAVLQPCTLLGANTTVSSCLSSSQLPFVRASSEVVDLMCAVTWLVGLVLFIECVYFWTSHISVFALFKPGYRFPEMYLWMYELISLFINTPSSVREAHTVLSETTPALSAHNSLLNGHPNHHHYGSSMSVSRHYSSNNNHNNNKVHLPTMNPFPFLTHVLFTRNSRVSDTPTAVTLNNTHGNTVSSNNTAGFAVTITTDLNETSHHHSSSYDDSGGINNSNDAINCSEMKSEHHSGNFSKCTVSDNGSKNNDDLRVKSSESTNNSTANENILFEDGKLLNQSGNECIMEENFWDGGLKRWTAKWYLNLSESAKCSIHALTYRRRHCTPDIIERLRYLRIENLRQCVYFAVLGALNVLLQLDCTVISFVPPSFLSALFFLSLPNTANASSASISNNHDRGSHDQSGIDSSHFSNDGCSGTDTSAMNHCANLVAAAFVTTVDISAFECFIACRVSYVLLFLSSSFYSLISNVTAASDGCTEECYTSLSSYVGSSSSSSKKNHHRINNGNCIKMSHNNSNLNHTNKISCWREWIRRNSPLSLNKHGYLQFMNKNNMDHPLKVGSGFAAASAMINHPTGIGVSSSSKAGRNSGNNNRNNHYYHHYSGHKKKHMNKNHLHHNHHAISADHSSSSSLLNQPESFESLCQRRAIWLHNYGRKDSGFIFVSLVLTTYNLFVCLEWFVILGLFFNLIVASLVL